MQRNPLLTPDELKKALESIDAFLESYAPGELDPHRVVREIFAERARQRPLLEKAIRIATETLERYAYHPELLRRRALAETLVVTPEGTYPHLERAEADYRRILDLDPLNVVALTELLDAAIENARSLKPDDDEAGGSSP